MVMRQSAPSDAPERPGAVRAPSVVLATALFAISLALLVVAFQSFSHPWSMLDLRVYMWGGGLVRHSHDPYLFTYR